jgi:hypothetical protein
LQNWRGRLIEERAIRRDQFDGPVGASVQRVNGIGPQTIMK